MVLENAHQLRSNRVALQFRRKVSNANPVVPVAFAAPQRGLRRGKLVSDPDLRA